MAGQLQTDQSTFEKIKILFACGIIDMDLNKSFPKEATFVNEMSENGVTRCLRTEASEVVRKSKWKLATAAAPNSTDQTYQA